MFLGEGYSEWYKQKRADIILGNLAYNVEKTCKRREESERIPIMFSVVDYYRWRISRIDAEANVGEAVRRFWKTHKMLKGRGFLVRPSHRDYLEIVKSKRPFL